LGAANLSADGVDGLQLAVEEGLEEVGGGEGVELALFAEAGEFFAGTLAIGELLLGLERAESLIDEKEGEMGLGGKFAGPGDGFLGRGAERVVHVEGEAEEEAVYIFFFDELEDGGDGGVGGGDLEDLVGGGEAAAFVAEGEADAAGAEVDGEGAHGGILRSGGGMTSC
jgi:hypothetical protein